MALIISKGQHPVGWGWEQLSERMIRAHFDSKHCKLIMQCYSPTNEAEEEDRDGWYEALQHTVSKVPSHGYMNAKVGADNTHSDGPMGSQGCGEINYSSRRLDFFLDNNLVIGDTIFQHRDVH